MNGRSEVVRALCEAGADPNTQAGKKHWGAIHYAARRSHLEALEIMLEFGADPALQGTNGETAYSLVKGRLAEVNAELARLTPVVAMLEELEDNADDNDDDKQRENKDDL
jgi:ankyrin repeat protein|eukprot:COSAG03_NODE_2150_length_3074_cov_1.504874_4_plen_110_part_00